MHLPSPSSVRPAAPDPSLLHIVLVRPEIPNNTGNIGRTAAAIGAPLHIVHPIAFDMSEKAVRRAGLDYWPLVDCRHHADWTAFLATAAPARAWLLSSHGERTFWDADFTPGDHILFGGETRGAPPEVHAWATDRFGPAHRLRIPMRDLPGVRSLNLATAVCTVAYEVLRQIRSRTPALVDQRMR
ncbi:MAG: tRNA (cytidine(34)-2'-O)-methyltransferase [Phycisphaeraceae bacterium]|nr:tRNA (cytidine(34)-2'-O)-methyltransferase [Phycisphaeraceae bacterium]